MKIRDCARLLVALSTILLAGCLGDSGVPATRVQAIDAISHFMRTGDTTGLRLAFADSLLEEMSLRGMVATRSDLIENYGILRNVSEPEFDSASHALVLLTFERAMLDVALTFDPDDRVTLVSVSIAPAEAELPNSVSRSAGSPLTVLETPDQFAQQFDADTGCVRLVSLLSPT